MKMGYQSGGHRGIERVAYWCNFYAHQKPPNVSDRIQQLNRYNQLFLDDIAKQEVSTDPWIQIPKEVTDRLSHRPTPLFITEEFKGGIVCIKYEGESPYGNYKLNTIAASVVAAMNEKDKHGLDRVYIASARSGNTLRTAIPEFCESEINVTAFWVKGKPEEQKEQEEQIKNWKELYKDKIEVYLSPSDVTKTGRKLKESLDEYPDGIVRKRDAHYEATDLMLERRQKEKEMAKVIMACSADHVSLHQSIIGLEIAEQLEQIIKERRLQSYKIVTLCCGAGTNAAGTNVPLILRYGKNLDARVIQSKECAPLTHGEQEYVSYDNQGILPPQEVGALKHFPMAIAASGINYSETSPLVWRLFNRGDIRAHTVSGIEAEMTRDKFRDRYGILLCLEPAHALAVIPTVVGEYKQKMSGKEQVIIVCVVTGREGI